MNNSGLLPFPALHAHCPFFPEHHGAVKKLIIYSLVPYKLYISAYKASGQRGYWYSVPQMAPEPVITFFLEFKQRLACLDINTAFDSLHNCYRLNNHVFKPMAGRFLQPPAAV